MKSVKMKYGEKEIHVEIMEGNSLGLLHSKGIVDKSPETEVIKAALENPIGTVKLKDMVKSGERVCIIVSDITRAWQKTHVYLPYIVEELRQSGIKDQDITFLCATGSHRVQTEEEHKTILGEELSERFVLIDHDCKDESNMASLGVTSFGTPVKINSIALQHDHIILTGAIVFHDLAGWGGGKKSVLPGIAAYESIMANHSLSLNPMLGEGTNSEVRCGSVLNNPVHLDMLEAAAMVKPSFLFNVIIDEVGNIGKAVAGDYMKAHEVGQKLVEEADSMYIKEKADIVLASAGGYPKDIDLYQASKALINAKEAVKAGGTIVLLAECMEGFGGLEVQQMLQDYCDILSREKALRENFSIAKYTGYLIAKIAEEFDVILISSLAPESVLNANIRIMPSTEDALKLTIANKVAKAKIYYMPYAANTLPIPT